MDIIGRKKEQDILEHCLESKRPEFLAVYGRRRVGKTYLIKEYFSNKFSFFTTGIENGGIKEQLYVFYDSLKRYGASVDKAPSNWIDAFSVLRDILESKEVKRDPASNKRIVFLDEVSWMNTAKSNFKSALEYFWNSWASTQPDLLLIICGSSTSWIIENIVKDTGGFYHRVTRQIHLLPFSLNECEQYIEACGIPMSRTKIIESYMVFGGIPFYLNLLDKRLSLDQNIDELLINPNGELHNEYERLFHSLFKRSESHMKVIDAIANKRYGLTRDEIIAQTGMTTGETLSKALKELQECGFIQKYKNDATSKNKCLYRIIDPLILFHHTFIRNTKIHSWKKYMNTPGYHNWHGLSFEVVGMNHIPQIKKALGISGIETTEYTWRSTTSTPGAQIDLVINRSDDVISICEMKYTTTPFEIDVDYERNLNTKIHTFQSETKTRKALHLILVTPIGLKKNKHSDIILNTVSGDDLFESV